MSDVLDLYTNSVRIVTTIYDVELIFMLTSLDEQGAVSTKETARIRMSLQHAMALSILLDKHLEKYEGQFREIFLPDELKKRLSGEIGETAQHET